MEKIIRNQTWLLEMQTSTEAQYDLFCFPYGGGQASSFLFLKNHDLPANIFALKLPGRGARFFEEPITCANELVEKFIAILPESSLPLVFYGHSMGAGLAFQTIIELKKQNKKLPILFIASGREPPHYDYPNPIENKNDAELIHYLQSLGGIVGDIPNDKAFLDGYLQKIRADYKLNTSITIQKPEVLPMKICILNGNHDKLIQFERLPEWSKYTQYPLRSKLFSGDHFFFLRNQSQFIRTIKNCWNEHVNIQSC